MDKNSKYKKGQRVIAFLKKEEIEYLDKLGLDSLFTTGSKLSRMELISALVNAAMALNVSAEGVKDKKELVKKMLDIVSSQSDRRKYPRLKKDLIVGLRRMDSMDRYEEGSTENIGLGGFMAEVAFLGKPLAVNQVIEITIKEPQGGEDEPIKAIGRVAWLKIKEDRHGYEIGVTVSYIKKEYEERFLKYLSEDIEK